MEGPSSFLADSGSPDRIPYSPLISEVPDWFLFWMWAVGILLGVIGIAASIILAAVT